MLLINAINQKLFPKKILLAGPYVGEFGHELLDWQGYVRARKPFYEKVHVITFPGREYFYEDCIVHQHDIKLENAGYSYGNMEEEVLDSLARKKAEELELTDYDLFNTNILKSRYLRRLYEQKFIKFYEPPVENCMPEIIFHFRNIDKVGPDKFKNYPPYFADTLVNLCKSSGYNVGCIGHPNYAYCPTSSRDFRTEKDNIKITISAICAAKLVVGEISGPMHLANLCGRSTLVWAQDQWRLDYCKRGNIFNVPNYFVTNNTFKPDPTIIRKEIDKVISKQNKLID